MTTTNLTRNFNEESFDFIFDKGALDSILCGEHSLSNSFIYLSNLQQLIKTGEDSKILIISNSESQRRINFFRYPNLDFEVEFSPYIINSGRIEDSMLSDEKNENLKNSQNDNVNCLVTKNSIQEYSQEKSQIAYNSKMNKDKTDEIMNNENLIDNSFKIQFYAYYLQKRKNWREKSLNFEITLQELKKEEEFIDF